MTFDNSTGKGTSGMDKLAAKFTEVLLTTSNPKFVIWGQCKREKGEGTEQVSHGLGGALQFANRRSGGCKKHTCGGKKHVSVK